MSKVLIINGSPRLNGNTAIAVREMEKVFHENGVEVTTVQIQCHLVKLIGSL